MKYVFLIPMSGSLNKVDNISFVIKKKKHQHKRPREKGIGTRVLRNRVICSLDCEVFQI